MFRAVVLLVCLASACGGSNGSQTARDQYVNLRTSSISQQMALGRDGSISGPTVQLLATETGYRGTVNSGMVDLRADGGRIVGTIDDRIVDLHVSLPEEGGLRAQGLFGGVLGRLEATPLRIKSSFGACHYDLRAAGGRYEGERACGASGRVPQVRPAALELPAGFEHLPIPRQAMLLAILLGA